MPMPAAEVRHVNCAGVGVRHMPDMAPGGWIVLAFRSVQFKYTRLPWELCEWIVKSAPAKPDEKGETISADKWYETAKILLFK